MSNSISNKQRKVINKTIFYALGYSTKKIVIRKQLRNNPDYHRIGRRQLSVLLSKNGEAHVRRFKEGSKDFRSTT